jgi:hypothetical protein
MKNFRILILAIFFLTSCGLNPVAGGSQSTPAVVSKVPDLPTVTPTISPVPTDTLTPSPTVDARISPERWQEWPVLPTVEPEMIQIFQKGKGMGNVPSVFTKIGDGEISTVWFLTQYDLDKGNYQLGSYSDLQAVINKFHGSFGHIGLTAGRGFNTSIILGLAQTGTPGCLPGDSRLACELRTYHPSFALLSLGTNQVWQPDVFEAGMQQIIQILLKAGVVPILSTKADNLEGNFHINRIIAQLAYKYRLPLWNFWLAVQPLSDHGLQADKEHLTYANSDFSDPGNFQYAWPMRNLTALQVLDIVSRYVTNPP